MPITPGCHPSAPSTMPHSGLPSWDSCSSAAWKISWLMACRSWLAVFSSWARLWAFLGSSVVSSCTAAMASSSRPAALILGPRPKPMVPALTAASGLMETSNSAFSPGRDVLRILASPRRTISRFSPKRGTISATVPRLTSSISSSQYSWVW